MIPNNFPRFTRRSAANTSPKTKPSGMYKEFDATELYCPKCKRPVPVRKRLLLVLPEGDKYEYLCAFCLETVGTKIDRQVKQVSVVI
jgi:hypothetical protein